MQKYQQKFKYSILSALPFHATNHTRDTLSWSVEELGTMSLKPWKLGSCCYNTPLMTRHCCIISGPITSFLLIGRFACIKFDSSENYLMSTAQYVCSCASLLFFVCSIRRQKTSYSRFYDCQHRHSMIIWTTSMKVWFLMQTQFAVVCASLELCQNKYCFNKHGNVSLRRQGKLTTVIILHCAPKNKEVTKLMAITL